MKKTIILLVAGIILLPSFLVAPVTAENNQNISITNVTYNPNPPLRNKYALFIVHVSIEEINRSEAFFATCYIDGEQIQVLVNGEWLYLVDCVLCDRHYYKLYYSVLWPDDNKQHTIKFVVDWGNKIDETNEKDNIKSLTLTGIYEPQEPEEPPSKFPFLEKLFYMIKQLFQSFNNFLSQLNRP